MPQWYAVDDAGRLAVFSAEHTVPDEHGDLVDYDEQRDEILDLTLELSRLLREDEWPRPGVHADVVAGQLQMLGSLASVQRHAASAEPLPGGRILATFSPPQRGRESTFMPGLRTFGAGDSVPLSQLARVHAEGLCGGCAIDKAYEDLDPARLYTLGLYLYECDEQEEVLERVSVPVAPLSVSSIGDLAKRCLRYRGEFARAETIAVRALAGRRGLAGS